MCATVLKSLCLKLTFFWNFWLDESWQTLILPPGGRNFQLIFFLLDKKLPLIAEVVNFIGATTFSTKTFSITTLSITMNKRNTQHYINLHNTQDLVFLSRALIVLNIVMANVIILNVVIPNVKAPFSSSDITSDL
jgi:hypothetical protein